MCKDSMDSSVRSAGSPSLGGEDNFDNDDVYLAYSLASVVLRTDAPMLMITAAR